jgi:hypothetical protein
VRATETSDAVRHARPLHTHGAAREGQERIEAWICRETFREDSPLSRTAQD